MATTPIASYHDGAVTVALVTDYGTGAVVAVEIVNAGPAPVAVRLRDDGGSEVEIVGASYNMTTATLPRDFRPPDHESFGMTVRPD